MLQWEGIECSSVAGITEGRVASRGAGCGEKALFWSVRWRRTNEVAMGGGYVVRGVGRTGLG